MESLVGHGYRILLLVGRVVPLSVPTSIQRSVGLRYPVTQPKS